VQIDTILSPAELRALAQRDLHETACVVFDILRATSTFVTALNNGAEKIIPVSEISEAVALKKKFPDFLLAGERDGVKIRAAQSGGVDFDFGNSPREFTPEKIRGKNIVSTTTNGTRALRACTKAKLVLAGSFLNLTATAEFLKQQNHAEIILVCAGTGENPASEDINAAGALTELLFLISNPTSKLSANTLVAQKMYATAKERFPNAIRDSENGRRLLANPDLRDDVAFCAQRDIFQLVAALDADAALRRILV
jgi:2-phosphosulfolactate phosphatase